MSSRVYRLKVRKIPLDEDIQYKKPKFPPFKNLHLDLLENSLKLRKNPPKPIFVRREPEREHYSDEKSAEDKENDFTLDELEKAYNHYDSSVEEVFSEDDIDDLDDSSSDHRSEKPRSEREEPSSKNYDPQQFEEEAEEEINEEERERQEVEDLLFKFMVLRRQYPNVEIPEFTDHSDLYTMRRVYDKIIRRVSLDDSVEGYKQYIVGGFMVLEWVSTNWLGIDLSGFTNQQGKMMNKYDRLLIELGEKNYSSVGSRFPVEVRLLFFVFFNAGLFYVQKMIFSGGEGGASVLNALFGGGMPAPQAQPQRAPRRRRGGMRGPTITPHEVEELTRNDYSDSSEGHQKGE